MAEYFNGPPPSRMPSDRQQLSEEVASYLRELIFSGEIVQGEFLRPDPIAERLGVSNTPVREALLTLRGEGLVLLIPRRGFVVATLSRQDVQDLFWAQAMIAAELAARAATRITKADLERLMAIQHNHEVAVRDGDVDSLERLGHQFHRLVNLAADSPRLAQLLGTTVRYLPNRFYARVAGQVSATLDVHPKIIDALKRRNARDARAIMSDHILAGGQIVLHNLEEHNVFGTPGDVGGDGPISVAG